MWIGFFNPFSVGMRKSLVICTVSLSLYYFTSFPSARNLLDFLVERFHGCLHQEIFKVSCMSSFSFFYCIWDPPLTRIKDVLFERISYQYLHGLSVSFIQLIEVFLKVRWWIRCFCVFNPIRSWVILLIWSGGFLSRHFWINKSLREI